MYKKLAALSQIFFVSKILIFQLLILILKKNLRRTTLNKCAK